MTSIGSTENINSHIDLVEKYAAKPNRTGEEQRYMLHNTEALLNCGDQEIETRAKRVIQHNRLESALNLIQGYASNTKRKPEEYGEMIPTAQELLHCGFTDIEEQAMLVIQELKMRQNARKWWQLWK